MHVLQRLYAVQLCASLVVLTGLLAACSDPSDQSPSSQTKALVQQSAYGENFYVLTLEQDGPNEPQLFEIATNPAVTSIIGSDLPSSERAALCPDSERTQCGSGVGGSRFVRLENQSIVRLDDRRIEFPLDKQFRVADGLRMSAAVCPQATVAGNNIQACLEQTQTNAFAEELQQNFPSLSSEDQERRVGQAIAEAIMLLTYTDRIPQCYQQAVSTVETFERSFPDDENYTDNIFRSFRYFNRDNVVANICGNDRSQWSSESCLQSIQGIYYNAIREAAASLERNATVKQAYEQRYLLGVKLGYRFAVQRSQPENQAYLPSRLASFDEGLGLLAQGYLQADLSRWLGQDQALLVTPRAGLVPLEYLEQEGWQPMNQVATVQQQAYAELLHAAVLLAKASRLEPLKNVLAFERQNNIQIGCQDVANYQLGGSSRRFDYIASLRTISGPSQLSDRPKYQVQLRTDDGTSYPVGSRVFLGQTCQGQGYCPLTMEVIGTRDTSRHVAYRVTVRRPLGASFVSGNIPQSALRNGVLTILSSNEIGDIIQRRVIQDNSPAPAFLQLEAQTPGGGWELLRSETVAYYLILPKITDFRVLQGLRLSKPTPNANDDDFQWDLWLVLPPWVKAEIKCVTYIFSPESNRSQEKICGADVKQRKQLYLVSGSGLKNSLLRIKIELNNSEELILSQQIQSDTQMAPFYEASPESCESLGLYFTTYFEDLSRSPVARNPLSIDSCIQQPSNSDRAIYYAIFIDDEMKRLNLPL